MTDTPPLQSKTERQLAHIAVMQTIMTAVAVLVSVIALYAALSEAASSRKQQDASVWPFLTLHTSSNTTSGEESFSVSFVNKGIGPARMRSIRMTLDGEVVRDWPELVLAVTGEPLVAWSSANANGTVFQAGETVEWFAMRGEQPLGLITGTHDAVTAGRVRVEFCYCSVFSECWLRASDEMDPAPVRVCERDEIAEFQR